MVISLTKWLNKIWYLLGNYKLLTPFWIWEAIFGLVRCEHIVNSLWDESNLEVHSKYKILRNFGSLSVSCTVHVRLHVITCMNMYMYLVTVTIDLYIHLPVHRITDKCSFPRAIHFQILRYNVILPCAGDEWVAAINWMNVWGYTFLLIIEKMY